MEIPQTPNTPQKWCALFGFHIKELTINLGETEHAKKWRMMREGGGSGYKYFFVPAEPEVAKEEKASRDHNQRQHGTAQSTHFSHPLSQSYWFKFSSNLSKLLFQILI